MEQLEQRIRREEQQKAKQVILDNTNALAEQILTNVLVSDYWQKSAKKRIPKFVDDCMSLYEAFTSGVVKMSEMVALTEEYAGIKLVQDEQFSMFAEKVGEHEHDKTSH